MHDRPMPLIAFYSPLKVADVSLVPCSGGLFLARGRAALAGRSWPLHKRWRSSQPARRPREGSASSRHR